MELNLNKLHYFIYCAHYTLHLFANRVNPFNLVHKLPFQKKRYEELGIDIHTEINKAFGDKRSGMSVMVAGGGLFGLLFIFQMGIINFLIQVINFDVVFTAPYFIGFAIVAFTLCYLHVFKNDKYLEYFKEFEKWPKVEKRKNSYLSICFIIAVFCVFFGSLLI